MLSVLLMLFAVAVFAQRNSWDGWMVKPRGEIRMLNFFVNIIYDVHPEREKPFAKTNHWNMVLLESLNQNPPDYLLRLMDTVYNPNNLYGCITRLYGESSFDELQITGYFVVVNIKESRVLKLGSFNESNIENAAVDFINEQGGLQTMYGHNDISYYDNGSGKIGFIQFFFRNTFFTECGFLRQKFRLEIRFPAPLFTDPHEVVVICPRAFIHVFLAELS